MTVLKREKRILKRIEEKRFARRLRSKEKRKARRQNAPLNKASVNIANRSGITYEALLDRLLPVNLKYVVNCPQFGLNIRTKRPKLKPVDKTFMVPRQFSIVDFPEPSFNFIKKVLKAILSRTYEGISIDYSECVRLDLGAQVFFDILMRDVITFIKRCRSYEWIPGVREISEVGMTANEDVKKLLYSVGSPVVLGEVDVQYPDIIPYKLCIHNREETGDPIKISEKKELDTTRLVEYVIECLGRLGRTLTPERLEDLYIIVGEVLINAEEHSTTKHRFSIGYFHEITEGGDHYGVFRLAILNFGKTIYEKFSDPECPNKSAVLKMKALSKQYTRKRFLIEKEFEEDTLWTLYALQEGITSVDPAIYRKRGNGSIRFIESFFNIRGPMNGADEISSLSIVSGNTNIRFDGKYEITSTEKDGEEFRQMTFNTSGSFEDKPDSKYVKYTDQYFPGTMISAKILFREDDFQPVTN